MWLQTFFVSLAISAGALKAQVDNGHKNISKLFTQVELPVIEELQGRPIYYATDDASINGYVAPAVLDRAEDTLHDMLVTPSGYLLPPAQDTQNEYYYKPTEPGEQTDWYPIAPAHQKQIEVVQINPNVQRELQQMIGNVRTGKVLERTPFIPVPSTNLLPPREDAPNDFILPDIEIEVPSEKIDHTLAANPTVSELLLNAPPAKNYLTKLRASDNLPVDYITPHKNVQHIYKNPTRLYPKKYQKQFKPVPIPMSQVDESIEDVEDDRTTKQLQSHSIVNNEFPPNNLFEKSHGERKSNKGKRGEAKLKQAAEEFYKDNNQPKEQEASATYYRQPERYAYSYPTKQAPLASLKQKPGIKSDGERTEFRMHGMKGPHSYQFGFDTGKGKNRQFRYEERDNDGHVRGHYGYVDKFGKLRVVNYDADPKLGFRAEAPVVEE